MKKIIYQIVLLVMLLSVQSTALAFHGTIAEEEINIGGIGIGTSLDYVKQVYGQPTEQKNYRNYLGQGIEYNYNNLFIVDAAIKQNGDTYVSYITCKAGNLKTPSGFAVGTPYKNVTDKYSKFSMIEKNGFKIYTHFNGALYMEFKVDKQGLIKEITCYLNN